jgi:hypothetical protein
MFRKVKIDGLDEIKSSSSSSVIMTFSIIAVAVISIASAACLIALFVSYINLEQRNLNLAQGLIVGGASSFSGPVTFSDAISSLTITDLRTTRHTSTNITADLLTSTNITAGLIVSDSLITQKITTNELTGTPNILVTSSTVSPPNLIMSGNGNIGSAGVRVGTIYSIFTSVSNTLQLIGSANVGEISAPAGTVYSLNGVFTFQVSAATGEFTGNVNAATFNGVSDPQIKTNMISANKTTLLEKFMAIKVYDYGYTDDYTAKYGKRQGMKVIGFNSTQIKDIDSSLTYEGSIDLSLNKNTTNILNITYVDKLALIPLNIKSTQISLERLDILKSVINIIKANTGMSNPLISQIDALLNNW